ncbi:MAG TPA: beta-N-acetylhexosaminidase [Amaricoccus sp.]|uniref:beta-N-acetylhexosaminidase n=1 Tax=Amaricoccus sp. TaxID=1872485 RepID=UPI002CC32C95|nr:beta-N-acetylhexosaminidase [Amaricoccus sp.]HMQ94065.1 beta-N-acetylhexosaminidase [Amaricoccus sp.]HMR53078.1 beta-N-acetylhexosaminidase [Amaricoccus sp.]HMR60374.1 beta-N-acetylhexosaminidase [Amaricoccus sp.]HMT99969.1 beta-N-acetylhexosaminidase [Amaricoccus sp.]
MAPRAVILGCQGPDLGADERRFLAAAAPWGFILFARNIETPGQLRRLTGDLREAVGRDAPILIDQEGGRVARMRGPDWREWAPALEECARLPGRDLRARAMYLRYRLIAAELRAVGIDVNCAPVLDVVQPDTHGVIRNRCYGADPAEVAAIGRAVAEGLIAGGVLPVMKHMPGHGRATRDSHVDLPQVSAPLADLERVDFAPFRALADLPAAMSAHVVYAALDAARPATLSPEVMRRIRGDIGFDGLLMTDDLSMQALRGPFGARAEAAIAAGCDMVLHCNGDPAEAAAVAEAVPELAGRALARAERAQAVRGSAGQADPAALEAEFVELRERAAGA